MTRADAVPAIERLEPAVDAAPLSAEAFAELGLGEYVYMKPVQVQGGPVFEIRAADGECIAVVADETNARRALLEQDLRALWIN